VGNNDQRGYASQTGSIGTAPEHGDQKNIQLIIRAYLQANKIVPLMLGYIFPEVGIGKEAWG